MKIEFTPVGVSFEDTAPNVELLKVGSVLSFEHRPAFYGTGDKRKEYPNAIVILFEGKKVGSLAESTLPESPQQTILGMINREDTPIGTVIELMIPKEMDVFKRTYKLAVEIPVTKEVTPSLQKQISFTGEEILYDELNHKYYDLQGNKLLSGSKYAEANSPKFELGLMLPRTAKSWGVDERTLGDLWQKNSEVSMSYGTTIHSALELAHLYWEMGEKIQKEKGLSENYCLSKNDYIKGIVVQFVEQFGVKAEVEVLVTDVKRGRAGRIDRLEIIDLEKKICRVGDYKTNNELDKAKLKKYGLQMSFYAEILEAAGWSVIGLDVFHHDGEWHLIELDRVEIK